jgi:hypothetical protein
VLSSFKCRSFSIKEKWVTGWAKIHSHSQAAEQSPNEGINWISDLPWSLQNVFFESGASIVVVLYLPHHYLLDVKRQKTTLLRTQVFR